RVVLAPVAGVKPAEVRSTQPGFDKPSIRRRRRQKGTRLRGERGISRQTIAQGMSDALRCPVCSCAPNYPFCTRDRGCSAHPAFPAPSFLKRCGSCFQNSGASRREIAESYSDVNLVIASAATCPP